MTNPDPNRPQPVTRSGAIAGLIGGAFSACLSLWFLVIQGITVQNLPAVTQALEIAVAALVSLFIGLAPYLHAKSAAQNVTPLSDPMDNHGRPLVPQSAPQAAPQPPEPGSDYQAVMDALEAMNARLHEYDHAPSMGPQAPDTNEMVNPLNDTPPVPQPVGMHAHPTKKLGKLAPIPGRKAVPFGAFVTSVPDHPLVDKAPSLTYPMDHNDQAGDCVVAGLDHTLQTICAQLGVPRQNWSDAELLAYYRTQNPNFHDWSQGGSSADGGMVIQTFLEYLVSKGVILAFGKVDHTNEDELKAAVYLGLAVVTGEILDVAQQNQWVWDYKPSAQWGGHCTCTVGYNDNPDRQVVVTWGATCEVTQAFIAHQMDEAWFVLTQAHVDHPGFRNHFDLAGFAAAVSDLTGGKVVVPVPAPQPPAPGPAPTPGPAPAALPADVIAWAQRTIVRHSDSHADKAAAADLLKWAGLQ